MTIRNEIILLILAFLFTICFLSFIENTGQQRVEQIEIVGSSGNGQCSPITPQEDAINKCIAWCESIGFHDGDQLDLCERGCINPI